MDCGIIQTLSCTRRYCKNKYSHATIMEDNVGHTKGNIYKRIEQYHNEPDDWNIVFESDQNI